MFLYCNVLQYLAVFLHCFCSVLLCVAAIHQVAANCDGYKGAAARLIVLQCVTACCGVLKYVAVCCSL